MGGLCLSVYRCNTPIGILPELLRSSLFVSTEPVNLKLVTATLDAFKNISKKKMHLQNPFLTWVSVSSLCSHCSASRGSKEEACTCGFRFRNKWCMNHSILHKCDLNTWQLLIWSQPCIIQKRARFLLRVACWPTQPTPFLPLSFRLPVGCQRTHLQSGKQVRTSAY